MYYHFPYINGFEIAVTKKSIYKNSSWVHSSLYPSSSDFVWEIDVIQVFVNQIQDDFTILDIGAQTGVFSLASKFYPKTKWHSFEPDPWNYSLLVDNLALNNINNVTLSNNALSHEVSDSVLKICPGHRGLNTLGKNLMRFSSDEAVECPVKTNTIDNLFLDTKIDLIKIDTEGCEYNIIIGGLETINKYKPKILLEYVESNLQQFGYSKTDLSNLIEKINYEIFWSDTENIFIQSKVK